MKQLTILFLLLSSVCSAQTIRSHRITINGSGQSPIVRSGAAVWYNVVDYGAIGDGITHNTAAFQSAVDSCHAAGGGTVFVPAGTYLTGQVESYPNVRILGDGKISTIIRALGDTVFSIHNLDNSIALERFEDHSNTLFEDLYISGRNVAKVALYLDRVANYHIGRCYIDSFAGGKGLMLVNSLIGTVEEVYFKRNQYGVIAYESGGISATTLTRFSGCGFQLSTKWGVDWSDGGQLLFDHCDFAGNGVSGDTATGSIYYHENQWPGGLHIRNSWMEANYGTMVNIVNNVSVQSALTLYPVQTVHSIVGFQDLGQVYEFATRNIYLKGSNQVLSIVGSTFSGAAKSVVSDGANTINYMGTTLNNGTTMRGGATITKVGD